jgi:hypothetical protein
LNRALWIFQVLLALLFLFAGTMKFIMPMEAMTKGNSLPGPFFRFIGAAEILGALGLILPGLLRIGPILTPLAAAGLAVITVGATVVTLQMGQGATAVIPFIVACLSAFVAYGRWRIVPLRGTERHIGIGSA